MSLEEITGLVIVGLVMLIGLVGSLIPALPSTTLVLGSALLHKLYFEEASASWAVMIFLGIATTLSLVLENAASMIGAKKLGATWRGIVGSCIGCFIGAFTPFIFIGMFVGTFVGALLFELMGGREFKEATRAGLGAMVGLLAGAFGKLVFSIAMIGAFSVSAVMNTISDGGDAPDPPPIISAAATNAVGVETNLVETKGTEGSTLRTSNLN
ncbi:MAG: hypothetical protein CMO80_15705 [Verrucomicrobiales bacterium]|nr:hypothetical protein [Verrucomicrobiales bacterium]|tara:strand:- start:4451 stop:5086 length:636 start_codon:yes stop_codon:yes gene_type:complete